jgi:FixJ family two-component response regulator
MLRSQRCARNNNDSCLTPVGGEDPCGVVHHPCGVISGAHALHEPCRVQRVQRGPDETDDEQPSVLVVEDDERLFKAFRRNLSPYASLVWAPTVSGALDELASGRFSGAIIDIKLPDGSGLSVLAAMRSRGLEWPVLVLTGHLDGPHIAKAQLHGAECLSKPPPIENLIAFVARADAHFRGPTKRVERVVERFARQHRLTKRQREILTLAIADVPRRDVSKRLGVSDNTVKTHTRSLLRKTKQPSLTELARLLRITLRGG